MLAYSETAAHFDIVYRVFGCQGESTTDALIQGLLRAARDGVDIINLSGGSAGTWTSDAVAVVADNVVKQGITVIVSQGLLSSRLPFLALVQVAAGNFGNQGLIDTTDSLLFTYSSF